MMVTPHRYSHLFSISDTAWGEIGLADGVSPPPGSAPDRPAWCGPSCHIFLKIYYDNV
jgi:hypothetical protein